LADTDTPPPHSTPPTAASWATGRPATSPWSRRCAKPSSTPPTAPRAWGCCWSCWRASTGWPAPG